MKKSIIFLINGLGIERPGSYSIAIDEAMPNLSRIKETSYFTTAITSSLEYKEAYENFFLGDTSKCELAYLKQYLFNDSAKKMPLYLELKNLVGVKKESKIHIFIETLDERIVEQLNTLFGSITEAVPRKIIYLHLILSHQTVNDYKKIDSIVSYIQFHLRENIRVGFIFGKESISDIPTKNDNDYLKKMFFSCSCERWTDTTTKFNNLESDGIRPCDVKGFCTTKDCYINNEDMIFFFNTRRENYDNIIQVIYGNAEAQFKDKTNLPIASLIKLYSNYEIPAFIENVEYENSLSNILIRNSKKCLIITDRENVNLINFYANGLNSFNNPIICFMEKSDDLYSEEAIKKLINELPYDFIIFDFKMDTSSTINHLKDELSRLDIIINNLAKVCEDRHSLFITSLYGLKKTLPIADYNSDMVTIDYELRIPIFFYDYGYPKSKYDLFPGDTNDILSSALKCITNDENLDTLIREKNVIGSILKSFIR